MNFKYPSYCLILSVILIFSWASCTPQAEPIAYGKDECYHCKMTIVDQQHAAQLVNTKGKSFKFDAIECMVHYLQLQPDKPFAMQLVCDYKSPGTLIDAKSATYLISQALPSPMGAYLTAFKTKPEAEAILSEKGGKLYNWEEMKKQIER